MAVEDHNKMVIESLQIGDVLSFQRAHYSHYGIYVGDLWVIQMLRDGGSPTVEDFLRTLDGVDHSTGHIHKMDFWTTTRGCRAQRDNYLDGTHRPLEPEEIVHRAEAMVGQEISYNMLEKNCEHWATWCRYDVAVSRQAELAKQIDPAAVRALVQSG